LVVACLLLTNINYPLLIAVTK